MQQINTLNAKLIEHLPQKEQMGHDQQILKFSKTHLEDFRISYNLYCRKARIFLVILHIRTLLILLTVFFFFQFQIQQLILILIPEISCLILYIFAKNKLYELEKFTIIGLFMFLFSILSVTRIWIFQSFLVYDLINFIVFLSLTGLLLQSNRQCLTKINNLRKIKAYMIKELPKQRLLSQL